jgi:cation diffusion facilitator family transporter
MNKQQAAMLSIFSNTILIIFKLVSGIIMGSISVISEAIHSSIDLLASLIAYFSIKISSSPEDTNHPFGHGKFENVSGFVEAILIFFAALLIIYEAVKKIIVGGEVENLNAGIIVMLISSAVNFIISMKLLKISKETDSIALEADAMHLLTDVFTSLGVFFGLIVIKFTGIKILDPIVAIAVALLIMKTSVKLINKSLKDLVDSSLPEDEINEIINIVNSYPEVTSYHKLRTRKSGSRREIDIHVRVNRNCTVAEAHDTCHNIENQIKSVFPNCYTVVHVEPEKN